MKRQRRKKARGGIPWYRVTLVRAGTLRAPFARIRTLKQAAALLAPRFKGADREQAIALALDPRCRPTGVHLISMGDLTRNTIHPREALVWLIAKKAYAWILAHNHPTGCLRPSRDDLTITRQLRQASDLVQIPLLDHIIFGPDGSFVSLGQRGWLDPPATRRARGSARARKGAR